MKKPYPDSLGNPPLLEMIVEFRFKAQLPDEALFGLYYPIINQHFSNHVALPIMNIPLQARTSDPALIYQPHYHFLGHSNLSLLIGPKVLIFKYERFINGESNDYPGWRNYIAKFISEMTSNIMQVISVQAIERIGIRYVDFFEGIKLRDYITPSFSFPDRKLERLQVTCSCIEEGILHNINLSDSAEFKHHVNGVQKIHKLGSIIDIDSEYIPETYIDFLQNIEAVLTRMHDGNKNLFYEIMKEDLVSMYHPIYKGKKNDFR